MRVVEIVGFWHELVVPVVPIRARRFIGMFAAADQQNRRSSRIKRKQHTYRPLGSQFLHMSATRLMNVVDRRTTQPRTGLFDEFHASDHRVLILTTERFVPLTKLIGVLNLPSHSISIDDIS